VTDIAHLQAFRLAYKSKFYWKELAWQSWDVQWYMLPFVCTFCGNATSKRNGMTNHHLELLQDPATIRPFRLQLLGLLGNAFSSHPVFDDLKVKA